MKRFVLVILTGAVFGSGCASGHHAECPPQDKVHDHHAAPTAQSPKAESPLDPKGYGFSIAAADSGKPVSPKIIHEDNHVKIAVVAIQPGATMPEHAAQVPVTVQTVSGAGEMTISGAANALEIGRIYYMDAGAPHALKASGEEPLVVLVHYIKGK